MPTQHKEGGCTGLAAYSVQVVFKIQDMYIGAGRVNV